MIKSIFFFPLSSSIFSFRRLACASHHAQIMSTVSRIVTANSLTKSESALPKDVCVFSIHHAVDTI